jgi:LSD1 subclass zinc finger protein
MDFLRASGLCPAEQERRKLSHMIPQDLLDILVCPACRKPLLLKETGESLRCTECRRVYPVRDNIPILLIDQAVTDPS